MKTLILTPSIALGLGLASNAIAEIPVENVIDAPAPAEVVTHKQLSLVETSEFYQGDFLVSAKKNLKSLAKEDLYTGMGATESITARFVTF